MPFDSYATCTTNSSGIAHAHYSIIKHVAERYGEVVSASDSCEFESHERRPLFYWRRNLTSLLDAVWFKEQIRA